MESKKISIKYNILYDRLFPGSFQHELCKLVYRAIKKKDRNSGVRTMMFSDDANPTIMFYEKSGSISVSIPENIYNRISDKYLATNEVDIDCLDFTGELD